MIDIERQPRKAKSIPLVSLIDVVFMLLIYLMLTTSFTRSESLELALPAAATSVVDPAKQPVMKTLHIYISNTGEIFLERKSLSEQQMSEELTGLFTESPDRGVLVLSASKVSVGSLVKVLDRIYSAGGRNIAVADWLMQKSEMQAEGKHNG
jgi:biopolymer transport protein ExbD